MNLMRLIILLALAHDLTSCSPNAPMSETKDDSIQQDKCIVMMNFEPQGIALTENEDELESQLTCATKDSIIFTLGGASLFLQAAAISCALIPDPTISKVAAIAIQGLSLSTGYIAWRSTSLPCTDHSLQGKIRDELCSELHAMGLPCINNTTGTWIAMDAPAKATKDTPIVMNMTRMQFRFVPPSAQFPAGIGSVGISLDTCIFDENQGSVCSVGVQDLPYSFDLKEPSRITGPGLIGKFLIVSQADAKYGQATFNVSGPLGSEPMKSAFERAKLFKKIED